MRSKPSLFGDALARAVRSANAADDAKVMVLGRLDAPRSVDLAEVDD